MGDSAVVVASTVFAVPSTPKRVVRRRVAYSIPFVFLGSQRSYHNGYGLHSALGEAASLRDLRGKCI